MRWWQRQRRHLTPDEPPEVADPVADTEGSVVATEARNRLWHHLLALPSQDRDVLILHHLEDLSVRSVAEVLDCSEAAVKTRLHRARKRLRDALQGEDEYRDG